MRAYRRILTLVNGEVPGTEGKRETMKTTATISQFDYHRNPTPGFPCDVCGCPGKVRARHRALTAADLKDMRAPKGVAWVKSVSKCFGTTRDDEFVTG